jgi:hypothetical protein
MGSSCSVRWSGPFDNGRSARQWYFITVSAGENGEPNHNRIVVESVARGDEMRAALKLALAEH